MSQVLEAEIPSRGAPDLATLHNLQAYGGAFQHLLQRLADGRALANAAAAATLVAERRLGTELARLERRDGRPRRDGVATHRDTIRNLGVDPRVARFWEQVAAIPTRPSIRTWDQLATVRSPTSSPSAW